MHTYKIPSAPLRAGTCYPTERIDLARYLSDRRLQIRHSQQRWTSLKVLVVPHFLLLSLLWKDHHNVCAMVNIYLLNILKFTNLVLLRTSHPDIEDSYLKTKN